MNQQAQQKNRKFVLFGRQNSNESFYKRDKKSWNTNIEIVEIEVDNYLKRINRIYRILFRQKSHQLCADLIVKEYHISSTDILISYWSNYILSVTYQIAKIVNSKIQVFCHAHDVFCKSYLGQIPQTSVQKYSFCCKRTMEWAKKRHNLQDHRIQYQPHPIPQFPRWIKPPNNFLTVLNIARNTPKKNLPIVCKLVNKLAKKNNKVRFIQVGGGRMVKKYIKTGVILEQYENISFQNIICLFMRANVFLYGSKIAFNGDRDGLPNVLREAGAMGVPVCAEKGWANDQIEYHGPVLLVQSFKHLSPCLNWIENITNP